MCLNTWYYMYHGILRCDGVNFRDDICFNTCVTTCSILYHITACRWKWQAQLIELHLDVHVVSLLDSFLQGNLTNDPYHCAPMHITYGSFSSIILTLMNHNGVQIHKLIDWFICYLLAVPDLWKRTPLNCSITMVFASPLLSSYKI